MLESKNIDFLSLELEEVYEFFNGKSLLITGASGLIGSNLISFFCSLAKKTDIQLNIVGVNRSQSLYDFKINNFSVIYRTGDISNPDFLSQFPLFDYIIHAAGYGQPSKFLSDPYLTIGINSEATNRLLRLATSSFVFLSTSEIYSGLHESPYSESQIGTTNTDHPRAAYIEGKRVGEALTLVANSYLGVRANACRLALAYGPGVLKNDSRVLNELIVRGIEQKEVVLRDSGKRMRTYCYVDDAIDMILGVLIKGKGEIYNVGGQSRVSVRDLGSTISQILCVPFTSQLDDSDDSSPEDVRLDLAKVKSLLGKKEFIPFEIGLTQTIRWYEKLLKDK
jgi:UDP-glucuronate decarboxylase